MNWVKMQETHDCIYSVVDYHAITTPFKPEELRRDTRDMLVDLLATGLDPEKCALVVQSELPQHTELAWILGSITPLGWLERVPTYKEKASMHPDYLNLGLLSYPVLMASDILVYRAEAVPVGEDQLPHLELTREIVRRFNHWFGDTFPEPEAIMKKETARIMSLKEPEKKMSKSLGEDSYIGIGDDPETIHAKIKRAVTDMGPDSTAMGPGVANLFNLLQIFGQEADYLTLYEDYETGSLRYVDLKTVTADAIIEGLRPIREKRKEIKSNPEILENALQLGHEKASAMATKTLSRVKERIGVGRDVNI